MPLLVRHPQNDKVCLSLYRLSNQRRPRLSGLKKIGTYIIVVLMGQLLCTLEGERRAAGVTHFICRFGSMDQFGQVERFAKEVLPAFS